MRNLTKATWFRCKKCDKQQEEITKQMEESGEWTEEDDKAIEEMEKLTDKGVICCDCGKTFKKGEKKYDL